MATKFFRDPIHGLIEFSDSEKEEMLHVVNSAPMQRLRRIKQCGFADYVYPSLTHTRFEHALGAYHVMGRYLTRLIELSESTPPKGADSIFKELRRRLKDRDFVLALRIAALVHDCGHLPFSHASEEIITKKDPTSIPHLHERLTIALLDANAFELKPTLASNVSTILSKVYDRTEDYIPVQQLLNSALDVDRLDYLSRDSHHGGLAYVSVDLDWILRALDIGFVEDASGRRSVVLAYQERRGLWAIEQVLQARRTMYLQVYRHRVVQTAGFMYEKLIERISELLNMGVWKESTCLSEIARLVNNPDSMSNKTLMRTDDIRALAELSSLAEGTGACQDAILHELSSRLLSRKLFVTIEIPYAKWTTEESIPALEKSIRSQAVEHLLLIQPYQAFGRDILEKYFCGTIFREEIALNSSHALLYYIQRSDEASKVSPFKEAAKMAVHPDVGQPLTQVPIKRLWVVAPREIYSDLNKIVEAAVQEVLL